MGVTMTYEIGRMHECGDGVRVRLTVGCRWFVDWSLVGGELFVVVIVVWLWLWLVVVIVVVVVIIMTVVVVMMVIVVIVCRVGGWFVIVRAMAVAVIAWLAMAFENVSSVAESGITAGEDVSADTDHVICEGELLAVEHEEVLVLVEAGLGVSASPLEVARSISLSVDFVIHAIDPVCVDKYGFVICLDVMVVVVDAVFDVFDVTSQVEEGLLHGFEGDQDLGFGVEPCLVLLLVPDGLPFIELVDSVPEVAAGNVEVMVWIVVIVDWRVVSDLVWVAWMLVFFVLGIWLIEVVMRLWVATVVNASAFFVVEVFRRLIIVPFVILVVAIAV